MRHYRQMQLVVSINQFWCSANHRLTVHRNTGGLLRNFVTAKKKKLEKDIFWLLSDFQIAKSLQKCCSRHRTAVTHTRQQLSTEARRKTFVFLDTRLMNVICGIVMISTVCFKTLQQDRMPFQDVDVSGFNMNHDRRNMPDNRQKCTKRRLKPQKGNSL